MESESKEDTIDDPQEPLSANILPSDDNHASFISDGLDGQVRQIFFNSSSDSQVLKNSPSSNVMFILKLKLPSGMIHLEVKQDDNIKDLVDQLVQSHSANKDLSEAMEMYIKNKMKQITEQQGIKANSPLKPSP